MKKILCAVLAAMLMCVSVSSCKKAEETSAPETTPEITAAPVRYTAVLKPKSETNVVPNARGKIIKSPYNEGDYVSKGALLYEIEDNGIADNIATTKNAIKKADITINSAKENVDDLVVKAPASGILHNFSLKAGERVSAVTIGTIIDESVIVAKVPFTREQRNSIAAGMNGVITSADYMSSIPARVTRVYDSQTDSVGGAALYYVELTAANPGGFNSGDSVGAVIENGGDGIISPVSGTIEMPEGVPVVSRGSGNATEVTAREGDYVTSGQILVRMENSTVNSTKQRAELDKNDLEIKLRGLEKDYADLKVYAPASGIISEQKKALNDSIASTSDTVMVITDSSSLTMDIDVSEEDKNRISEGMSVNVSIDSLPDTVYTGTVSAVSQNERITGGEKLYAVTITINNESAEIPAHAMASVSFEN